MGNSPFAMSFEEIKAQADANMRADKGETAPVQEAPVQERSFLDMVEAAERELSGGAEETPAEPKIPGGISFDEMFAQAGNKTAAPAAISFDDLMSQAQAPAAQAPAKEAAISFDDLMKDTQAQTQAPNHIEISMKDAQAQEAAPAAISFDDLMKDAQAQTQAPVKEAAPVISFDDLMKDAQAQTQAPVKEAAPAAISFDDLMKDAQAAAKEEPEKEAPSEISFDEAAESEKPLLSFENFIKKETPEANEAAPSSDPKYPKQQMTFEELMANAQAQVAAQEQTEEAVKEETPVAESVKEETPVAEPVKEPVKEETPVTEAVKEEVKEEAATEEVKETPAAEPVKEEPKAKSGSKKSKKAASKKEEDKEPLPDTTEDYKVDVLGEQPQPEASLSMEKLFAPEEIEAFRTDIRTLVRSEFKKAMVGVLKELLTEFSE